MQKRFLSFVALLVFVAAPVRPASAGLTNRYVVKDNASAAIPYDSLANAAADIQTAINYAQAGETVLVSAATYDTGGLKNWPAGRVLTNRVVITNNITVRSLNNDPATTIIRGAWHPVTTNGPSAVRCVYIEAGSSLVGFTLTNGATLTSSEGARDDLVGGGVNAVSTAATISNCVIAGCSAFGDSAWYGRGAGGAFRGTFFNCTISGNSTPYCGGGAAGQALYAPDATCIILSNCTVSGNSAGGDGGGVYAGALLYGSLISNNTSLATGGGVGFGILYGCVLVTNRANAGGGASGGSTLSNCTVICNTATTMGGGVYGGGYVLKVYNSAVISNTAGTFGGGSREANIFNSTVSYNISQGANGGGGLQGGSASNCVISYNTGSAGGGVYNGSFYNCLIYGNEAWGGGGAYGDWALLYNCTVVGNSASRGGGVYGGSNTRLNNTIIYDNKSPNGSNHFNVSAVMFTNSCTLPEVPGWMAGNINSDPFFVACGTNYGTNHVPGNYRLQSRSPCVNRGLNQNWMMNATDLDGNMRIRYGAVDMGAYEAICGGTIYKFR